jgi:hypothetical protein
VRSLRVLLAGAVLASVVVGCSFILDVEGPLPPAANAEDAAPEDGAVGLSDADAPDAAADLDAAETSTGACALAGSVRFCDDFGRPGGDAGGDWAVLLEPGGQLAVLPDEAGGGFLRASVVATAETGRAALSRTFAETPATRVRLGFRARFATRPTSALATATLILGQPPNARSFSLLAGPDSFTLAEIAIAGGVLAEHPLATEIPLGRFVQIDIRIGLDTTPPNLDVLVDGATALSTATVAGTTTGVPTVLVGVSYAKPTPAWELDVDDVIVDFE